MELEGFQQHHVDEGYPPAKPRLQSINKKEWDALSHVEQAALLEEVKKNRAAHRRQPVSPHFEKLMQP
ncbi:hypothetical protein GCM10007416_31480 [Kroppenstedtia guangzhouensis]|uniref:Uncharacterized protein n=1 Tax=Kroppenstedtia guangzhouensis TaxID=1274356 RepID=A0ABQ1H2W0_9BACL|nr:hypothetical protein [Kroppenstedtia guangzhouensis]GGA55987.1 hypothetical protein GCM10007416_31480 [Kroppenstedtia guangzhouensis]